MELRLLRYFMAVADELHFGRAAQRLHIEQPPLSQQIRKLERELGVDLFQRSNRMVRLTDAGRIFYSHARRVLAEAEQATEAARRAARGELGHLRIGFVSTALFAVLPRALREFRAMAPDVELSLREAPSTQQLQALLDGTLDVGLIRPPLPDPLALLESRIVHAEPLVACLPAGHRLARKAKVALDALREENFVWFPREVGLGLHEALYRVCQDAGFVPSVVYEASEIHGIVGLVAAGLGVGLVPASMQAVSIPGAVYRPLARNRRLIPLAACWRRDNCEPTLGRFLDLLPAAQPT